ncbi:hypothetical protein [Chitinivibrio alkaliphilus]|uniref:Uncharacterized protein n=1 Tax=Chitinivibrio alkaliphilus ACht1 TaxID=1313304 RepID=U7D7D6_9BACT|nr:hypothetical protein [Chitinivibrio alkaliphilus]ERP31491.1 hypothetical protein CALK_1535 [Chitinivibrio alkaliphilus ACht1]
MDMIYLLDLSFVALLFVIAYLSRRIGEALMIQPHYKLFYFSAFLITIASLLSIFAKGVDGMERVHLIALGIRGASSLLSLPVAVRYWSWLFNEDMRG